MSKYRRSVERLSISEENVAVRLQKLCDTYPESHVPRDVEAWQWSVFSGQLWPIMVSHLARMTKKLRRMQQQ